MTYAHLNPVAEDDEGNPFNYESERQIELNNRLAGYVARGDHVAVARQIALGTNVRLPRAIPHLLHATDLGHMEIAELLLEAGADVDAMARRTNALLIAVGKSHLRLVLLLLRYGAYPGGGRGMRRSPLLTAMSQHGDRLITERLIEAGATVYD
jgi:hypothetical protein